MDVENAARYSLLVCVFFPHLFLHDDDDDDDDVVVLVVQLRK